METLELVGASGRDYRSALYVRADLLGFDFAGAVLLLIRIEQDKPVLVGIVVMGSDQEITWFFAGIDSKGADGENTHIVRQSKTSCYGLIEARDVEEARRVGQDLAQAYPSAYYKPW